MRRGKPILCCLLVLAMLLALPVVAVDRGAGRMLNSSRSFLATGLESFDAVYADKEGTMQAGYGLELNPDSPVYPIMMACDTMYGGMTMDEAVAYTRAQGYNVVAAVNTAYYTSPGVPIGIVVENGKLRSAADGMHAVAILPDGSFYAAQYPKVRFGLAREDWEEPLELQHLNKTLEGDSVFMYTADFSTVSTRVTEPVWAVCMAIRDGELTLTGTLTLEVTEILEDTEAVPIGADTLILTARKDGANGQLYTRFAVGDTFTLETRCADETLREAAYVSGCGDILVENGKMTGEDTWFPYNGGNHPRTLLGWRSDGTLVVYVADGRQEGYAAGLTRTMAAEEMLRRACQFAVNMDGGGSSIVGARLPGRWSVSTLNRPCEGGQRRSAAYLMLVTDEVSDGKARYWHLEENGSLLLPNQKIDLHAFATDGGLYPVEMENPTLFYSANGHIGTDPVFTAPERRGRYQISVWGGGASGKGQVQVIEQPTYLQISRADGRPLGDQLVLQQGQKLPLRITASHYGKPVYADETAIVYTMSAPLGWVDANGVFTAHALAGTQGELTLTVGGYEKTLHLTVVEPRGEMPPRSYPNPMEKLGTR